MCWASWVGISFRGGGFLVLFLVVDSLVFLVNFGWCCVLAGLVCVSGGFCYIALCLGAGCLFAVTCVIHAVFVFDFGLYVESVAVVVLVFELLVVVVMVFVVGCLVGVVVSCVGWLLFHFTLWCLLAGVVCSWWCGAWLLVYSVFNYLFVVCLVVLMCFVRLLMWVFMWGICCCCVCFVSCLMGVINV